MGKMIICSQNFIRKIIIMYDFKWKKKSLFVHQILFEEVLFFI